MASTNRVGTIWIRAWLISGLRDLWFAQRNQGNDVYSYGTFFFVMAAEKHLKSVLLHVRANEYEHCSDARAKVTKIAKSYGHDFRKMVKEVDSARKSDKLPPLFDDKHPDYPAADMVEAMREVYMESRYPTPQTASASRRFPAKAKGVVSDPIGSSFFTGFCENICVACSKHLYHTGFDLPKVVSQFTDSVDKSSDYDYFKNLYLAPLLDQLDPPPSG